MNTAEQAHILGILQGRRDLIADHWYTAIADTGFASISATDVYARLVALTDQLITLLVAEPFDRHAAQAIGAALVDLRFVHHKALGYTQEALARQVVDGLPAEQIIALLPRLMVVLSELAAGFFRQARATILAEQEGIRAALVADLRRSEERMGAILTNVPLILFATDQEGVITLVEGKGLQALGMTPCEMIEQSIFAVTPALPEADAPRILDHFRRALAGEAFTVIGKVAGRVFETRYAPLRNEQDAITGVIGVAVDITERMRAEAEVARVRRLLGERQERERLRLAADLHDDAVSRLLGIGMRLDALEQRVRAGQDAGVACGDGLAPELAAIRASILEVEGRLRTVMGELHPPGLADLGLSAALAGYVARVRREGGAGMPVIELDLVECDPTLPMPVAVTLFRVAQEALRNALRHAGARRVTLRLRRSAHKIVLRVRDDGHGFQPPEPLSALIRTNHFGLASMADRVAWAGGQLTVDSQPGSGTEVVARIPLTEAEASDD
jgi:PAS domain S-box-containing protein